MIAPSYTPSLRRPLLRPPIIVHRKHVFADLAPYMCIRSRCSCNAMFYTSKKAWVAHDTVSIRSLNDDVRAIATGKCLFCAKEFNGDIGRFYTHVAHHMEDIRLFALSPILRRYDVGTYENGSQSGSSEGLGSREEAKSTEGETSALREYVAANQAVDAQFTREWAIKALGEGHLDPLPQGATDHRQPGEIGPLPTAVTSPPFFRFLSL
jgi:hypothetical protein